MVLDKVLQQLQNTSSSGYSRVMGGSHCLALSPVAAGPAIMEIFHFQNKNVIS